MQVFNEDIVRDFIGDDKNLLESFKARFMKQAQESTDKLLTLSRQGKIAEIKSEAHFLKSSAHSMGAEKLYECLVKLESSATENQIEQCLSLIDLVNEKVHELERVFAQ